MKKILLVLPLGAFLFTSCQLPQKRTVKTLPPIVEKTPPSELKTKPKRTYRSKPTTTPKVDTSATAISNTETVDPLLADPAAVSPVTEIPRFEVPENVQPKVSDGINQAEFIELKW